MSLDKSVLIVTPSIPGGLPTQGSVIAAQLRNTGVRVGVLSIARSRIGRLVDVIGRAFWMAPRYRAVLVDVFGERAFVYESFAILCAWVWKRRLVVMLHNGMLPDFVARWPTWTRFVLSKPHIVLTPHAFLKERLAESAIKVHAVLPNHIELERYSFQRRSRVQPRFLYLRGMHSAYNPEMAVRAFGIVQGRYPNASLTMAGRPGPEASRCSELVNELGLRNVRFAGLVSKDAITRLAEEHDIHLHTNRFDNMPVTIIEMWACGLPIVGTNVGGMPYFVRDGVDAILVPSEDHDAMADACLRLLAEPDLAERLSTNGRLRAEALTWNSVKESWEHVLFGDATLVHPLRPTWPRESDVMG